MATGDSWSVGGLFGTGAYAYANGQIPVWNAALSRWVPGSASGTGDVVGPAASVDGEVVLYDGTTGKLLKRATGTGIVRVTSGVYGTPGNVDLASEVTGDLPVSNLDGGSGASGSTFWRGDGTWATPPGGTGTVVQIANTQTGSWAFGSNHIPLDDTIPQNTEGDEYMTLAITPTDAANKLQIVVVGQFTLSGVDWATMALFQDSTANALAAARMLISTANGGQPFGLTHTMTAGTTSATTFKVRVGRDASATIYFNGYSGGRLFGGTMASSITITEYVP